MYNAVDVNFSLNTFVMARMTMVAGRRGESLYESDESISKASSGTQRHSLFLYFIARCSCVLRLKCGVPQSKGLKRMTLTFQRIQDPCSAL